MSNRVMWVLLGVLGAMLVLQTVAALPADSRSALLALCAEHDDLGPALAAADRGDTAPLSTWLVRAPTYLRLHLARVQLAQVGEAGPSGPDGRAQIDDRSAWPFRHRLRALAAVTTGDAAADATVANMLAYVLATGCERPSSADIAFAATLVERIERRLRHEPAHEMWDTVACVRFQQGDWARAKAGWTAAIELLAKEPAGEERSPIGTLYRARLDAVVHNLNPPPHSQPRPLPRDLRRAEAQPGTAP